MTAHRSSVGTHSGLVLFIGGTVAIAAGYTAAILLGAAPGWAPWSLAFGASSASVGLFVLGSATRGPVTLGIGVLLAVLLGVLCTSFGAALALPANETVDGPLLFGLPTRLAIVFYGVGFVPLLALPLAFALTFNESKSQLDD